MTHTGEKTQRTGKEVRLPNRCAVLLSWRWDLPHLRHEVPHGLGCFILFLAGGVGVGAEGEPGVVVPQHGGDGFDVHAVLKSQGGEGVPEIRQMFINTKTERYKKPGSHRKKEFL